MFSPLTTDRLVVRPALSSDVEALHRRRNDPEVARLQAWTLPYSYQRAVELVTKATAMPEPVDELWWMATLMLRETGEVIGDLVVHPTNGLASAEIGYSLAREHWGHGYAVEAVTAWVGWLFESMPLTRASAQLHPDNRASAMVLERTGFVFEGHTRLSFWNAEENSDDWIYGMTRPEWQAWRHRPRTPPSDVHLVEVTAETKTALLGLRTHRSQEVFAPTMGVSLADALLPDPENGAVPVPWLRAILADGRIVGFVMVCLPAGTRTDPLLTTLLVDRMHQRRGIGRRAIAAVASQMRALGFRALLARWAPGKGSPGPFFEQVGLTDADRTAGGLRRGRLELSP